MPQPPDTPDTPDTSGSVVPLGGEQCPVPAPSPEAASLFGALGRTLHEIVVVGHAPVSGRVRIPAHATLGVAAHHERTHRKADSENYSV